MRKWAMLGVGLLVAGAFAAGNAVPKLKHPWAGAFYNRPVGKTMLEWRCLETSFRPEHIGISREWLITALVATPTSNGVLVKVNLMLQPGASKATAARRIDVAVKETMSKIRGGLLKPPETQEDPTFVKVDPFCGDAHVRVEFYANGTMFKAVGETAASITKK